MNKGNPLGKFADFTALRGLDAGLKVMPKLGQFLTATPVADFMATMFGPLPRTVRLLDAGAGAGALTAAFVSRLCEKK